MNRSYDLFLNLRKMNYHSIIHIIILYVFKDTLMELSNSCTAYYSYFLKNTVKSRLSELQLLEFTIIRIGKPIVSIIRTIRTKFQLFKYNIKNTVRLLQYSHRVNSFETSEVCVLQNS